MLRVLSRFRTLIGVTLALTILMVPTASGLADNAVPPANTSGSAVSNLLSGTAQGSKDPYFYEKLAEWKKSGASDQHHGKVTLAASRYAHKSDNAHVKSGDVDGVNNALVWNAENDEWVEYDVTVDQAGLYRIDLSYRPVTDGKQRRPVTVTVMIDGKTDFLESRSILLQRQWQDAFPAGVDSRGDQIRPMSKDISGWTTVSLRDSGGAYTDPLQWYLTPGRHILRISTSDMFALGSIALSSPIKPADYETVRKSEPAAETAQKSEPIVLEAEQAQCKSDSALSLRFDKDIASTPYVLGKITYNAIDGKRWATGNQQISWSFAAPEDGYYKIGMRALQSFSSNRSTFRTIMINGQVPFAEMLAYRFPYASGWQGLQLEYSQEKPYEFYLKKGINTLSMRVTQAPVLPMMLDMEKVVEKMRLLAQDLKALTGGSADKNRTWILQRDLPGFLEGLQNVAATLEETQRKLVEVNGRPDAVTQGIITTLRDIRSLLGNENAIPYQTDRFITMQGRVSDLLLQLKNQPLQLDRLYIVPADTPFPRMKATFFKKVQGSVVNFFNSFTSRQRLSDLDKEVLNVWVLRGRDYVNLLQQLSDEMFTPQTGIKVKVNLLPDTNLLVLMNAAGIAPDVALGLPEGLPFDYAVRNGLYDLAKFPDFNDLYKRFAPGSWVPFNYNGGYYAVPETQSFSMLYYRKDILDRLKLKVPNTWQDVYDMLPVLQQNNLNMMPVPHTPFFFQNGAEYIQRDGLKTGLGTEKGYQAFKEWTDISNVYAVDRQVASFYQSFRTGAIPIGISDFSMYIQLMVAAPELNGYWGVAPIPGVRQPDGNVARWMGGGLQTSVIFKKTKKAKESWEFLKWWTSAEVQERYGMDLETLNGLSFRWNTSNVEAFVKLPWKPDDLQSILEQWRWFKEIPNVPGSYFLERELQNAWNRTVIDGVNYRSSLETSIVEIEREMKRKLQEFGFIDASGKPVRSLNLPDVSRPWEGVDPYVRK